MKPPVPAQTRTPEAPAHRLAPPLSRLLTLCAQAVGGVRSGHSLTELLAQVPAAERPAVQSLAFQVLRRLGAATALRQALAPRQPPAQADALLLCALALLWPGEGPPAYAEHTVVDQTVNAARRVAPASAGFINAVLRRFLRERGAQVQAALAQGSARWNHPDWWIAALRQDWPEHWQGLLAQAGRHPPMALRVNIRRAEWPAAAAVSAYQARLAELGMTARPVPGFGCEQALVLDEPVPVDRLPGFAQGDVSVQDVSAQRAAALLLGSGLPPGARVLDACAAPGGKTAHLLELADLDLLALDADANRLRRVEQTLDRLGLKARTLAADASRPEPWWDGQPFDAILLDAPCSASGIVRRHPDIAWLRRASDISALARTQAALLDALWPLLKPGGRLLYATCSVFKAEGQAQIDAFLQRIGAYQARLDPISPGHLLELPDNPGDGSASRQGDGFFYALLHRSA